MSGQVIYDELTPRSIRPDRLGVASYEWLHESPPATKRSYRAARVTVAPTLVMRCREQTRLPEGVTLGSLWRGRQLSVPLPVRSTPVSRSTAHRASASAARRARAIIAPSSPPPLLRAARRSETAGLPRQPGRHFPFGSSGPLALRPRLSASLPLHQRYRRPIMTHSPGYSKPITVDRCGHSSIPSRGHCPAQPQRSWLNVAAYTSETTLPATSGLRELAPGAVRLQVRLAASAGRGQRCESRFPRPDTSRPPDVAGQCRAHT